MAARSPREARFLGLWTAGWLAVLLVVGLLWVGDLSLQWPVLLVPVVWGLIAVRPRSARGHSRVRRPVPEPPPASPPPAERRLPPTRELPWLPEVPPAPGGRREE